MSSKDNENLGYCSPKSPADRAVGDIQISTGPSAKVQAAAAAVAEAAAEADAVIVGSAVVKNILEGSDQEAMKLIASMRQALDNSYHK